MKFLCEQCKAKYQIADEKAAGKTVRMKCRKCGYLIEVRAAATETLSEPPIESVRPPPAPAHRPAPPRPSALAAGHASPKGPAPKPPSGPLAGALKTALQREEEVSAPIDMSDLSPSDEWYVAINGVPVGPIRMAEVRRKAAIGAVTEESLCWQEGLDEWRPLRSFPELAAIVREAFVTGRASLTPPPPEIKTSSLPPQSIRPPARPAPAGVPPRPPPARVVTTSAPAPVARNNVVPIVSRLATAEKLSEEPDDLTRPFTGAMLTPGRAPEPSIASDPFAPPRLEPQPLPATPPHAVDPFAASPALASAPVISTAATGSMPDTPAKKSPPWMAIAMVAAATAFGVTAGLALFLRPAAAPAPAPVAPGTAMSLAPTATAPTATAPEVPEAVPSSVPTAQSKPAGGLGGKVAAVASTAPTGPRLNLNGIGDSIAPVEDPGGGEGPRAPGQCLSEGQIQQVIGMHSVGLRRACWERGSSQKLSANITVSLTVGADGSAQGVSANGDDSAVASCIAGDVRNWHFPAMGCSQRAAIPFHFVRQ